MTITSFLNTPLPSGNHENLHTPDPKLAGLVNQVSNRPKSFLWEKQIVKNSAFFTIQHPAHHSQGCSCPQGQDRHLHCLKKPHSESSSYSYSITLQHLHSLKEQRESKPSLATKLCGLTWMLLILKPPLPMILPTRELETVSCTVLKHSNKKQSPHPGARTGSRQTHLVGLVTSCQL